MYQEQLNQISQSFSNISEKFSQPFYLLPEFWTLVVALCIGIFSPIFTEWLTRRPKKSNLVVIKVITIIQENNNEIEPKPPLEVSRLVIENKGKHTARIVEAYIENISDNGEIRKNFIPMPLMWTHGQLFHDGWATSRDIYPNQTVYLDILNYVYNPEYVDERTVLLAVPAGTETNELSKLAIGNSQLTIKLYQESGQVNTIILKISWNVGSDHLFVSL